MHSPYVCIMGQSSIYDKVFISQLILWLPAITNTRTHTHTHAHTQKYDINWGAQDALSSCTPINVMYMLLVVDLHSSLAYLMITHTLPVADNFTYKIFGC